MTERDFPCKKPPIENPPENEEPIPTSPDIKKQTPADQPIKMEEADFLLVEFAEDPSKPKLSLICIWQQAMGKPRKMSK
jgi:hypothetical protein